MIATVALLTVLPVMKVGQKWEYEANWRYRNTEIDTQDIENFKVEITKVQKESMNLKVSRKVEATMVGDVKVSTLPSLEPFTQEWVLFPNGSVAYSPVPRDGIDVQLHRIWRSILPEPVGAPSRSKNWELDIEDRSNPAAIAVSLLKRTKEGNEYIFSYRENNGLSIRGAFVRDEKMPFPRTLQLNIPRMQMPGGSDFVRCDVEMKLKKS